MSSDKLTYIPVFFQGEDPYESVIWTRRDAVITNQTTGEVIFKQLNVEAPDFWSTRAVRVVAQEYFRGRLGTPERENSVRQIVSRVVETIGLWATAQNYFNEASSQRAFLNDLTWLILHQAVSFNSPVWFNLGVPDELQQCSACFILSVEDDMSSISALQTTETAIYKLGSGAGVNLSKIRSQNELLSGGGTASGPLSFMRALDAWAGVIKSGGKTRRAATMRILNINHPDIMEFITCKSREEDRAQALVAQGYSPDFNDPNGAYASVAFQNANHTVRVTRKFMRAVQAMVGGDSELVHALIPIVTGIIPGVLVRDLWSAICAAAHRCGDPALQFDDMINYWNTVANDERINATNPCAESVFLDNTACNLASLNLMSFKSKDGFKYELFQSAVRTMIIAQDILVSKADYPTQQIKDKTLDYRPLGLGFTNMGAFLMSEGMPYDSDQARTRISRITSVLTSTAYVMSAELSRALGPFPRYEENKTSLLRVLHQHKDYCKDEFTAAGWRTAIAEIEQHGCRNAQVTLMAPTGTIAFMMDCDTTGIEPESSLIKTKYLVGGGSMKIPNRIIDTALKSLHYKDASRVQLLAYLAKHGHFEGSELRKEHLPVFDCAIPSAGTRMLSIDAHLKMMAAIQPYISGGMSKTVNLPANATVEDFSEVYLKAFELGLKSVAVYRDASKLSQPLVTAALVEEPVTSREHEVRVYPTYTRHRLRNHQTNGHRIRLKLGDYKVYLWVTPYEDTGLPGEFFVATSKEGSTVKGYIEAWAQAVSFGLQAGVPLAFFVEKFSHTRFEPAGLCSDPDVRFATSLPDAIMRKLDAVFLKGTLPPAPVSTSSDTHDTPPCPFCGALLQRHANNCFSCPNCGTYNGCG